MYLGHDEVVLSIGICGITGNMRSRRHCIKGSDKHFGATGGMGVGSEGRSSVCGQAGLPHPGADLHKLT